MYDIAARTGCAMAGRLAGAGGMIRYVLLCLLPLAACAGPTDPITCNLRHLSDIPVTLRDGAVTVPVMVDDHPVMMLLDTAVGQTSVTPTAASTMHLQGESAHFRSVAWANVNSLDVGGQVVWNRRYNISTLGSGRNESGVIGMDWLQRFDVEVDLSQHRIALYREEGCSGRYIPWAAPYTVSNATEGPLLVIPIFSKGQQFKAQIDTGIDATRESRNTEARLRANRNIPVGGAPPARDTKDIGPRNTSQISEAVLPSDIVPYAIHPFNDQGLRVKADVLLGTNFLQTHRVWLSYSTEQVFIQRLQPAG